LASATSWLALHLKRSLMKVRKTYFMLMVQDMDRATAFYRDVFELSVRFVSPEWSELSWGDATVAFHGGRQDGERRTTGLGFEVDDLEAACAAVEAAGGTVVMRPSDRPGESIRLADVADPEGNVLSVAQTI
jgi:lactoylglutathione lyase